jgi:hypothetical protein
MPFMNNSIFESVFNKICKIALMIVHTHMLSRDKNIEINNQPTIISSLSLLLKSTNIRNSTRKTKLFEQDPILANCDFYSLFVDSVSVIIN